MAEVLGVVASSINVAQLAGNVASTIVKLKAYWDQVKEAPAEIVYLLREIESLNLILSHIRDDQARQAFPALVSDNIYVQQSLKLCTEGADELAELVEELAGMIEGTAGWRKRVASAKVVLRKEDIKRLKRRMKNAIRLLSLSYQCHTGAMIQLQPDIIVARISNTITSSSTTKAVIDNSNGNIQNDRQEVTPISTSNSLVVKHYESWTSSASWLQFFLGSIQYRKGYSKHKGKERQEINAKYQLPAWFSTKVWECKGHETLSGWRLNLRTYRIIPLDSRFFDLVGNGDIHGVQDMLKSHEAFVSDRDLTERTALHVAAGNGHVEMCKLLLSEGSDPLALDVSQRTPLHTLRLMGAHLTFVELQPSNVWEICRLLLNTGANEVLIDNVARRIARAGWHNTPILIREALSEGSLDSDTVTFTNDRGQTLLHILAAGVSKLRVQSHGAGEKSFDDFLEPDAVAQLSLAENYDYLWHELVGDCITAGAPLHVVDELQRTPFCTVADTVSSCVRTRWGFSVDKFHKILRHVLHKWLADLLASGIDLQKYGAEEKALGMWKNYQHSTDTFGFKLVAFSYGARIEDWHFVVSGPADNFSGDFWATVEGCSGEQQPNHEIFDLAMPGLWPEGTED